MAGSSIFNPATGVTDQLVDPSPGTVPVGPTGRSAIASAANDAIETTQAVVTALYQQVQSLSGGGGGGASGISFTVAGGIPTFNTGSGTATITETNGIPTFTQ